MGAPGAVERVLWVTMGLNILVACAKLAVGYAAGNTTVLGDGFHSLLDGSNNVVALIAIHLASQPPDAEHPYGHRKFENAAAMAIGGVVFLMGWEILQTVTNTMVDWHRNGTIPVRAPMEWLNIAVVAGACAMNGMVAWWERREGDRLASPLLRADASHTGSDMMVTAMGLASLALSPRIWWIDPLLACVVVAALFHVAWGIMRDSFDAFTDRSRLDPEVVRQIAESIEGVENTHAVRSHGFENDVHLDLHIVVGDSLSAADVWRIEREVEGALRAKFPALTHVAIQHEVEPPEPGTPVWHDDPERGAPPR